MKVKAVVEEHSIEAKEVVGKVRYLLLGVVVQVECWKEVVAVVHLMVLVSWGAMVAEERLWEVGRHEIEVMEHSLEEAAVVLTPY